MQKNQKRNLVEMDIILFKQKQLMEKVPHPVRDDAYLRMLAISDVFKRFLLYLTSTGHKPWRPNPLDAKTQKDRLDDAIIASTCVPTVIPADSKLIDTPKSRMLVSTFGSIEESLEFIDAVWDDQPNKLEELTDELFFFLEKMALSGFTWEQVVDEYYRKWEVNIKRYQDAEKNDYSWDDRSRRNTL